MELKKPSNPKKLYINAKIKSANPFLLLSDRSILQKNKFKFEKLRCDTNAKAEDFTFSNIIDLKKDRSLNSIVSPKETPSKKTRIKPKWNTQIDNYLSDNKENINSKRRLRDLSIEDKLYSRRKTKRLN